MLKDHSCHKYWSSTYHLQKHASTLWFKQRGMQLSKAEDSCTDSIKPLLLSCDLSTLQNSMQILDQTKLLIPAKYIYIYIFFFFYEMGDSKHFAPATLHSYCLIISTDRWRMPDLHTVVPTCKMHCNLHVMLRPSWTWQHCDSVLLSLHQPDKPSPAFLYEVCNSSSLKRFSKVQNIKVRSLQWWLLYHIA